MTSSYPPGVRTLRRRPVTVQAIQWTGHNPDDVHAFVCPTGHPDSDTDCYWRHGPNPDPDGAAYVYDRLHATWVTVNSGDWVIRGLLGEVYPCAAAAAELIYDVLPEETGLETAERIIREETSA